MAWQVQNKSWYLGPRGAGRPEPAHAVYIGRERRGMPRGPLANPYSTEQNRAGTVTVVADPLAAFKRLLWAQIRLCRWDEPDGWTPQYAALMLLAGLPDGVLLCWCKPVPCHGDIVSAAVEYLRKTTNFPIFEYCPDCGAVVQAFSTGAGISYQTINRATARACDSVHRCGEYGACRSCQAPVVWGETKAGKRAPFNLRDGRPTDELHFSTCPQAREWSKQ